jgi:hypothetical protein
MAAGRLPTTDSGTVVIHLVFVGSFVALLLTGLRIASDDTGLAWLKVFDAVLPMEHLWFRHMIAALVLISTVCGYAIYLLQARLTARVRLDAARLHSLRRAGKQRWAALGTLVYWGLMLGLIAEIGTGIMLFAGADRAYLTVHLWATWLCLSCVVLHVTCHAVVGGVAQLTRIVRPAALVVAPPPPDLAELLAEQLRLREEEARKRDQAAEKARPPAAGPRTEPATEHHAGQRTERVVDLGAARRRGSTVQAHPAATALAVALVVSSGAFSWERATRPVLKIIQITEQDAPRLDGDLADSVWMKAPPVTVMTTQGDGFGGDGQSAVEIRAVHDGTYAYFSFVWADPTRSLKHRPLVKTATGWEIAQDRGAAGEPEPFNEDKFSVLLVGQSLPLIGAAIHLSPAPLSDKPASSSGRGLHYTTDGGVSDVWIWRASHGGANGHIDTGRFGPPVEPVTEVDPKAAPYAGGFVLDPTGAAYRPNAISKTLSSGQTMLEPVRLPRDPAAMNAAMAAMSTQPAGSAAGSDPEAARWSMAESESTPYSRAAGDKIAIGTIVPGIVMANPTEGGRHSVRGVGRWAAGRWTLEVARRLYTGRAKDVGLKTGVLMWVAAFDHAEHRHTRHLRPVTLEVE